MSEAWLLAFAALASLLAMAWLALAMPAHWVQVPGTEGVPARAQQRRLRVAGASAIAISFGLCLAADHASMAVLVWLMLLALSAFGIAQCLAWRPRWLRPLLRLVHRQGLS